MICYGFWGFFFFGVAFCFLGGLVFFFWGGGFLLSELELQKSYIEIRKTQANTVKALFAGTRTIHIENNGAPIPSCNKSIFSSIRVRGFKDAHSMNSPFHHVTVSFLILEVDLNTIFVPLWFNVIFIDFKFDFSSLSLNYL